MPTFQSIYYSSAVSSSLVLIHFCLAVSDRHHLYHELIANTLDRFPRERYVGGRLALLVNEIVGFIEDKRGISAPIATQYFMSRCP